MPFLQILWDPRRVDERQIVRVRDRMLAEVGPALMAVDPDHVVDERMVDVRVVAVGPLDRVRAGALATLFARSEPGRVAGAAHVVDRLRSSGVADDADVDLVVELVLNQHASTFDYAALE